MTDSDVNHLCPELLVLYREWLMQCHAAGLAVKVTITYRNADEQNIAFAAGKSKAKAGNSPHNCTDEDGKPAARAFDFACYDEHAQYIRDGSDPKYRQAGEIAEKVGLYWGGRWTLEKDHCKPDYDHIQLLHWKGLNQ